MKHKCLRVLIPIFISVFAAMLLYAGYILNLTNDIKDNVLRLHIVANSDSVADQALKLCVRDRVLKDFSDIFLTCKSRSEAVDVADRYKNEIKKAAEDEIIKQGENSNVLVEVGNCGFPTKFYEDIALPRGTYTAVTIRIGKAQGQNWWCVMYPPLCIGDNTVEMPENSKKVLRDNLTEEEYELISGEGRNIKIKFRIAEILGEIF